jgi:hypothetical protein
MNNRQYFASPIMFNCKADKAGVIGFQELATSGGEESFKVGEIYFRSKNFPQKAEQGAKASKRASRDQKLRDITIVVGELELSEGDQSFVGFLNYTRANRRNSGEKFPVTGKNKLTVYGDFPESACVPGFDYGCALKQHGFKEGRSKEVVAAHFYVDVTMRGFCPGESVSGSMLLELM